MEQAFFAPFLCSNEVESTAAVEGLPSGYDSAQRMFMAMEKSQNVTSAS